MKETKELAWYLKLAGNVVECQDRCVEDKFRCPLILIDLFRKIISDVLLGMIDNFQIVMLSYIMYCILGGVVLFIVKKLYSNRAQPMQPEPMHLDELNTKFEMLKYDIDMGYYYYLQNVCARISNAANEFTYMRRALINFLNLDPFHDAFVSVEFFDDVITKDNLPLYNRDQDADEDGNPVKLKHKLSFTEISETTTVHLRRIHDTFSCMNYFIREENKRAGFISSIKKMLFRKAQAEAVGLEMILDMQLYTVRAIGLVNDKHAGLMNNTPENITYNISIMESADRSLTEKLDVILHTLSDWLDLLYVRFVDMPHYNNIEYAQTIMPAIKRLALKLSAEKHAIAVLTDMVFELEQEEDYEVSEMVERAIEGGYDNALRTIYAEQRQSMKLSEALEVDSRIGPEYLHKLVCIRNAMQRAKDEMETEESEEEYILSMEENYRVIEKRCRKLLDEGERKTLELHSILRDIHYLVRHFGDLKTDYELRENDIKIIRNALNTKFGEKLTAEVLTGDDSNLDNQVEVGGIGDYPNGDQIRSRNLQ